MVLYVNGDNLYLLLRDLTGGGQISPEYIKVLPWDNGLFRVSLTKSQVRRINKNLPKIVIKERYE
jgi:hypothetical protein